jgi:hypothetical protein
MYYLDSLKKLYDKFFSFVKYKNLKFLFKIKIII